MERPAAEGLGARIELALGGPLKRLDLRRGQVLFRQGDPARAVYLVERGAMRLVRHTLGGTDVLIGRSRPGETLADAALFVDAYGCDAVADRASTVAACPSAALRAALAADSVLAMGWIRLLARQLHASRARLELRSLRSAEERYLAWRELGGEARNLREAAAELGLTPEALYRTVARLRKRKS